MGGQIKKSEWQEAGPVLNILALMMGGMMGSEKEPVSLRYSFFHLFPSSRFFWRDLKCT